MKTAIVTGAGAGIGEAICQKLSKNNYRVGMLDLNEESVTEASKKIENSSIYVSKLLYDKHQKKHILLVCCFKTLQPKYY